MKIAVTGSKGMIGSELVKWGCKPLICKVQYPHSIASALDEVRPNVVIHCAGMSDVDECEENPQKAFDINVRGTSNVVGEMSKDQLFVYISSDHVFNGKRRVFGWPGYTEKHKPDPVNKYGFTKMAAEAVSQFGICQSVVVRTSKVFDYGMMREDIAMLQGGNSLTFTNLIKRSFLHVSHFVGGLLYFIKEVKVKHDTIHIAGADIYSYYQFWLLAAEVLELNKELIIPRDTWLKGLTPRPRNAGLSVRRAGKVGVPLYSALDGLKLFVR